MTEYVAGFLFSIDKKRVALIQKQHPAWQKGRWNAIGGHIEKTDDCPKWAMRREFQEETGVFIQDWQHFCTLCGDGWRVHFYQTFSDAVYDVRTTTDEFVDIWDVSQVVGSYFMTNLPWLVRMALSMDSERALSFEIRELVDAA